MHDSFDDVAIFWDYENCPVPSNTSGYSVVEKIRLLAQPYGSVKSFKAYLEISDQVQKSVLLRSELQSSGVSLVDCPHNGRKDVADKMMIVDMFAHAIDTRAPSTVILISGDRDFAYAISTLRLRRYRIVLVTLSNAHSSLTAQASVCLDWLTHVLSPADASQRNSSHSRQGSSQEKQRAVVTPNVQSEMAEVDRDDDLGLLQTILDATEKRLLSKPYPSNISAERLGTSNQQYKDANSPAYGQSIPSSNKAWRPSLGPATYPNKISNDANSLNSAPSTTIANQKQYLPSIPKHSEQPTEPLRTTNKGHSQSAPYSPPEGARASLQHPPDPYISFSQPYRNHPPSAWPAVQQSPPVTSNPSFRRQPSIPSYGPPQSSQSAYLPSSGIAKVSPYGNVGINNPSDKPISKLAPAPTQIPADPTTVSGFARSDRDGEISMPVLDTPPLPAMRRSTNISFASPGESSSSLVPSSNASSSLYKTDDHPDHISSSLSVNSRVLQPEKNANKLSSNNNTSPKPSTAHRRTASSPSSLESLEPSSTLNNLLSGMQPTDESSSTSTLTPSSDCEASPSGSETTGFSSEFKSRLSPITLPPSPSPPPVSSPPPPSEVLQKTIAVAHAVSVDQASSGSAAAAVPQPKVVPEVFKILVECLQSHRAKGNLRPLRGSVSLQISMNGATYAKAGVAKFGQYVALAVKQGIVELGGLEGGAWISLKPDWYNASTSKAVTLSASTTSAVKDTPLPVSSNLSKTASTPLPPPQTPNPVTSTTTQFVAPSSDLFSPAVPENDKSLSPAPPTVFTPELVAETAQLSLSGPIPSSQQSSTSTEIVSSPSACKNSLPSETSSRSNEATLADDCTNKDSCDAAEEVSADPPNTNESQPVSSEDHPTDTNPPPVVQVVIPVGASEAPAPPMFDPAPQSFTPAAHPKPSPAIQLTDETKAPPEPASLHSPAQDVGCSTKTSNALPATKNDDVKSVTAPVPAAPSSSAEPKAVPGIFDILVKRLQAYKSNGIEQPLRSIIALEISKNGSTYKQAGVQTFAEYTFLAKKRGIIELGGSGGKAWISLKSNSPSSSAPPTQPEVVAPAPVTVPEMFKALVQCLQLHRSKGTYCPTWSLISYQINKKGTTYQKAGVTKFKQYIALAEKAGIVEYAAVANDGWVRLKPEWHDVVVT